MSTEKDFKESLFRCEDELSSLSLPYSSDGVSAGVPFYVEDCIETLDLNKELIRNSSSTFFVRVRGYSMSGIGIDDGDLVIVDKLIEPSDGSIAICYVDGEFTIKRVKFMEDYTLLVAENPDYKSIKVDKYTDFDIWGVVVYVIKKL